MLKHNLPIWVYPFGLRDGRGSGDSAPTDLDRPDGDLLGGKGASLAEMSRAGLPVPPGFTITTECCRAFFQGGRAGHHPEDGRA